MATLVYSLDASNPASYPGSGSSWYDVSGNSYVISPTCALVNSPTYGVSGDAKFIQFTNAGVQYGQFAMGSASVGNTPGTLSNEIYQQSFSMALWVRFDSTPFGGTTGANCQTLVTMRYSSGQNVQFTIASGANGGRVGFNEWAADWLNYPTHYYSSTNGVLGGPGYPLVAGPWYHVVGVWEKTGANAGFIKFYVNGFQVASLSFTGASAATFDGSYYNINFLNRSFAPDDATYCGDTSISSYQIYKGALSASEVYTLFRAGGAPFGYSLMATLSPLPKMQFFSTAGVPLVGGKLYTYAAGTTTPLATYTSQSGVTANTNPIILDSRGEANVWLSSAAYKLKLTTPADVEIWTVDNVGSGDQFGTSQFLSSVSGSDTITANVASPNFTAYAAGQMFNFVAAAANTTTSVTLNLNSLGAKTVTKAGTIALSVGDIVAGQVIPVIYDGTRFQITNLINLSSPPPIGNSTPSTGAFTTLSATSTISGTGFTNYLASPPAIGGTAANTGQFTLLSAGGAAASGYSFTSRSTSLSNAYFIDTDANANGMNINFYKNSASPAASDDIANLRFYGNDSTAALTEYVRLTTTIDDPTNASEDGLVALYTVKAGVLSERVRYSSTDGLYILDGAFRAPDVYASTTGTSANMVMSSSSGILQRSTSSLRYKNSVADAPYGLAEVMQLRPVTYKGNNDGDTVFGGFIAEEVHAIGLTQFVQYDDLNRPDALGYGNMVSLLTKAIQEQQAIIEGLKTRITALEAK